MTDEMHHSTREIWVHDFNEKTAQRFRDRILKISDNDPNQLIPVYIDSYGGYVDSLAKMIETMDEVDNRFITICSGKAMSCGAILFSHGDIRYVGNYSRIMIHNVSKMSWGDCYSLKAQSDEAMRLNDVFMGLLAENCNISLSDLQTRIKDATDSKEIWLSPQDAKRFGIADFIGAPEVQPHLYWQVETRLPKDRLADDLRNKSKKKASKKKATKKKVTRKTKKPTT